MDDDAKVHVSLYGPEQGYSGKYKDNLTGQVLKDELVMAARMKELDYFNRKGVWVKVPKQRARQKTGRQPISVRWVDVNKGDELARTIARGWWRDRSRPWTTRARISSRRPLRSKP